MTAVTAKPRWRPAAVLAVLALMALLVLGGIALSPAWYAPPIVKFARLLETTTLGVSVLLAVLLADAATDRGAPRAWTYVLAVAGGSVLGSALGWELRTPLGIPMHVPPGEVLATYHAWARRLDLTLVGMLIGGLATRAHVKRRAAMAARRRQLAAEQARAAAQRRTLESELQSLQARIEPQFLFSTLDRIRALYERDPDTAHTVLDQLIVYLRAALPHLRQSASSVDQETALVRSWLDIVSLGEVGWSVDVSVAETAGPLRLPALVLLPLIQLVVARATGGARLDLRIDVVHEHDRLRIEIATSTDAFADGIAGRPALEEIDDRLRAVFCGAAGLATQRTLSGSSATVDLPVEAATEPSLSV